MKKISFLFILIFLATSCKNEEKDKVSTSLLPIDREKSKVGDFSHPIIININDASSEKDKSILSSFNELSVLSLKNIPKLNKIGRVKKVINYENNLFVFDDLKSNILVFDQKGNYLKVIGDRGAGPEQYERINDFDINKEDEVIYILNNPYLLTYSISGKFIKKKLLDFYPVKMGVMKGGNIAFNLPTLDDEFCHLVFADKTGNLISKKACYPEFGGFIGNSRTGGVNSISESIYYNFTGSSVIYKIEDNYNFKRMFEFDLGPDMWLEENKNDVGAFRKKFKDNSVSFLYNSYCIHNEWLIFEYELSTEDDTSFGYYNLSTNKLLTKKSFEEGQLLDLFGVPVGISNENKLIASIDYEVYNEISNIKNTKKLLKAHNSYFYSELNKLNLENTYLLIFYKLN